MPTDLLTIAKKKPTEAEIKLLQELSRPNNKIDVLIPEDIDPKEWLSQTQTVCRAIIRAEMQQQTLMPVLGRLLLVAKAHQDIWKTYETFEAFMEGEVYEKMGVGRSTCFEAMRNVERWPELTVKEHEVIGRQSFRILNQAIGKGDEGKKYAQELLERAKTSTVPELREYCEEKNYLSKGETTGSFIRIPTNKKIEGRWKKFIKKPEIQAYCETDNPGRILERMMEECESEWTRQAVEQAEASQPEKPNAA